MKNIKRKGIPFRNNLDLEITAAKIAAIVAIVAIVGFFLLMLMFGPGQIMCTVKCGLQGMSGYYMVGGPCSGNLCICE